VLSIWGVRGAILIGIVVTTAVAWRWARYR
jgi:xanthine/uracil/vitamin C permease (AzgA family)